MKITEQKADIAHLISGQPGPGRKKEYMELKQDLLAARLKAGEHQAAEQLVDIYYQQIYLYMRRLGHSRQVSEDLTQDCFLQAWQHIGQLREDKALTGWLYRIAGNLAMLYWRRHKGSRMVSLENINLPDNSETENEKIQNVEQLGQLHEAVAQLPIKLRQAVVLHYMQHLSISEAAKAASIRQGTFKSRLNRALKALRKEVV